MSSFLLSEILLYRDVHFDRKIFKEGEAVQTLRLLIFLSLGRGRSYNGNIMVGVILFRPVTSGFFRSWCDFGRDIVFP